MKWDYDRRGNYWCASRDYGDGCCNFIYAIFKTQEGYTAEACNNAFGAERVAVKDQTCTKESVFKDRKKLMKAIEDHEVLWLYTGFCNCVGKITTEEY